MKIVEERTRKISMIMKWTKVFDKNMKELKSKFFRSNRSATEWKEGDFSFWTFGAENFYQYNSFFLIFKVFSNSFFLSFFEYSIFHSFPSPLFFSLLIFSFQFISFHFFSFYFSTFYILTFNNVTKFYIFSTSITTLAKIFIEKTIFN